MTKNDIYQIKMSYFVDSVMDFKMDEVPEAHPV